LIMSEQLYRVEKLYTTGWEIVSSNLTKSQASDKIEVLMDEGYGPERIRVIREK
jgi:hypothetical protein